MVGHGALTLEVSGGHTLVGCRDLTLEGALTLVGSGALTLMASEALTMVGSGHSSSSKVIVEPLPW